ncbi:GAP family protein [Kitasatospora sp. NPDC056138]|uniref:GAP family protein n=1 Tax=Kitasatospora sp. NPDC056138 TaxID=3345724 RepID=UPI0035DDE8A0
MGGAVGQMLASAVGVAISPVTLVATVLLLASPRGRVNGTAFVLGWSATLAALTTAVVAVLAVLTAAGALPEPGGGEARPPWAWWVALAVGLLLLLLGARRWRERPREGHVHRPPAWLAAVDRLTPVRSAGLAAALVTADPKNLLPVVGGAVAIATSGGGPGAKALALVLMVLVGSLCTLLPLAVHLCGGAGSAKVLGEWKAWMSTHNSAIATVLPVVLGAEYVGAAITGLSG